LSATPGTLLAADIVRTRKWGTDVPLAVTRRALLESGAGAFAASAIPSVAYSQTRAVRFTLPWLAQGTSAFTYVGKEKGFFRQRGIDLQISRGFGSLSTAQALANRQFDFGLVVSMPLILLIAQGLPLTAIGTIDYDATMGVGVLSSGGINSPKDLHGKKIARVPNGAEAPFFPAYAERVGIELDKIQFVNADAKIAERIVADKQVDAMTGIASSSLPVFMSNGSPAKWLLFSTAGLPNYGTNIVTSQDMLKKGPRLLWCRRRRVARKRRLHAERTGGIGRHFLQSSSGNEIKFRCSRVLETRYGPASSFDRKERGHRSWVRVGRR
jgi:NitT/TauT family transport system substrate-binding protein